MYFTIVTWIKSLRHSQNYPFPSIGQYDHFSGSFVKSDSLDFPRTPKLTEGVLVRDILGSIVDPLTDESHTVVSSVSGEIIGMAFSRPVLSGYALYHVAWHTAD